GAVTRSCTARLALELRPACFAALVKPSWFLNGVVINALSRFRRSASAVRDALRAGVALVSLFTARHGRHDTGHQRHAACHGRGWQNVFLSTDGARSQRPEDHIP